MYSLVKMFHNTTVCLAYMFVFTFLVRSGIFLFIIIIAIFFGICRMKLVVWVLLNNHYSVLVSMLDNNYGKRIFLI